MTSRPSFSRHFSWCVLVFPTVFPPCWEGPPVLLELVLLIHLVQKAQHSSHPRIKKLKKQHPFVPPAGSRLVIYFFFLSHTAKYELVYLIGEFHFGKTKDEVACSNEKHTVLQPTGHSQNASAKKHLLLGGKTFFTLFSSQCCTDCCGVIPKLYNINERRIRTLFPKPVSNKSQHVFQPSPTHVRGLQLFPLSF